MRSKFRKMAAVVLSAVLCLSVAGCAGNKPEEPPITITQSNKPILPGATGQGQSKGELTSVYVSVFENLAILSTYPVLEREGEEPECLPREISKGGDIRCGGAHEHECPITQVLIADSLVPQAMNDWFRNMVYLERIDGLEKIHTNHVTNMSHLFAGCERLGTVNIEGWDVSGVEDFTGIFDGCDALVKLPAWYSPEDAEGLS